MAIAPDRVIRNEKKGFQIQREEESCLRMGASSTQTKALGINRPVPSKKEMRISKVLADV